MAEPKPTPGFFIPKQTEHGASPVGNSYLSLFPQCPKAWFNTYYRPVPTRDGLGKAVVAQGIQPKTTALPLLEGDVFHTYSAYARGLDMINGAYHIMDLAPKGRDEDALPHSMAWLRRHDQYDG